MCTHTQKKLPFPHPSAPEPEDRVQEAERVRKETQRGLRGRELRMGCVVCSLFRLQSLAPAGPPALPPPALANRPRLSLRRALPTPSWGMLPNKSLWLLAHAGPCYCPTQMLSACSILHQPEASMPLPGQGFPSERHSLLVVSSFLTAPLH